jgi:hypothetical protein
MKWRAGHIEGTVKDVKDDGHVIFTTTKGKDVCGNGNQTVSSFVYIEVVSDLNGFARRK